jgi:hypothetical protein
MSYDMDYFFDKLEEFAEKNCKGEFSIKYDENKGYTFRFGKDKIRCGYSIKDAMIKSLYKKGVFSMLMEIDNHYSIYEMNMPFYQESFRTCLENLKKLGYYKISLKEPEEYCENIVKFEFKKKHTSINDDGTVYENDAYGDFLSLIFCVEKMEYKEKEYIICSDMKNGYNAYITKAEYPTSSMGADQSYPRQLSITDEEKSIMLEFYYEIRKNFLNGWIKRALKEGEKNED